MADKPNHSFLKVGDRWLNMNLVTDAEVREDRAILTFAAPMARRVSDPPGVVTGARKLTFRDPEEIEFLRKWFTFNDVT